MKIPLGTIIFLLAATVVHAAPDIEGTWKSDKAASMQFNQQHAILSPNQENFISQMLGHMIVEFKDGVAKLTMPDINIQKDGRVTEYGGFEKKGRYVIMGKDEDSVVLKLHAAEGTATLIVYHFVSEDQIWVYVPSASDAIDLHIREYFTRVK
jgi:hypothetical protein